MEAPIFSGIGDKLQRVLQVLDITNLEPPVWTLKENKGKIYLDICWSKIPATQPTCTNVTNELEPTSSTPRHCDSTVDHVEQGLDNNPSSAEPNTIPDPVQSIVPSSKKKIRKKKSPSTQKRDRQRLAKWIASKKSSKVVSNVGVNPPCSPSHSSNSTVPGNQANTLGNIVNPAPGNPEIQPHCSSPSRSEHDSQPKQAKLSCVICSDSDCSDIDEEVDGQMMSQCFNLDCQIPASEVLGGLKKCTRCFIARYCSRTCQAKHWKFHKENCAALASARQAANSTK